MTWHKHITRDTTSNSSKSFSLLSRTHKNIQLHIIFCTCRHTLSSLLQLCVHIVGFVGGLFFFWIMFSPHHYWKKLKLSKKKKSLLYLCSTQKHTESQLSSYKRTKTVNFHVTFLISQNRLRLSQLSACQFCLLILH